MNNNNGGVSGQGLLMIVIGSWLVLRTVTKDSTGRTLIDHVLDKPASTSTSTTSTSSSSGAVQSAVNTLDAGNLTTLALPAPMQAAIDLLHDL